VTDVYHHILNCDDDDKDDNADANNNNNSNIFHICGLQDTS